MNDPWAKELHRIHSRPPLPPDTPELMASLLDDETHCRMRNPGS